MRKINYKKLAWWVVLLLPAIIAEMLVGAAFGISQAVKQCKKDITND